MSEEERRSLAISNLNELTFGRLEAIGIDNLTSFQKARIERAIELQSEYIADNGDSGALTSISVLDVSMSFKETEGVPTGISPSAYSLMLGNGFTDFLSTQTPAIAGFITGIVTNFSDGFNSIGIIFETLFTALSTSLETNKTSIEESITGLLTTITTVVETVGTIVGGAFETACESVQNFVTENTPEITDAFSNIEQIGTNAFDHLSTVVDDMFGGLKEWWDSDGERIFGGFCDALGDVAEWGMKLWNDSIAPLIQNLQEKFKTLWDNHLKPLLDKVLKFLTAVGDCILATWNTMIKPVVDKLIDFVGPAISNMFNFIGDVIGTTIGMISDVLGGFMTTLTGIIDFITGVFTGDWDKAWKGVQEIFKGFGDTIGGIFKGSINLIIDLINTFIRSMNKIQIDVPEGVPVIGGTKLGFDIAEIPKLAKGGIINQPTLAMVGEAGKEAVMPLENNSGWIDELASKIAIIMAQSNISNNGDNTPIEIVIDIGGVKFGKIVIDSLNALKKQSGRLKLDL